MKFMLGPVSSLVLGVVPSLLACGSSTVDRNDAEDGHGLGGDDAGDVASGGRSAVDPSATGGASTGAGGGSGIGGSGIGGSGIGGSGSGGSGGTGSSSGCVYPAADFIKLNDIPYKNETSGEYGQGCDPIVSSDYVGDAGSTQVFVFSDWESKGTQGDGEWNQQLVLSFPGQTTGEFTDVSATPANLLFTSHGALCPGYLITISVQEYGPVGGTISGGFEADLLDAQQSGECPVGVSGEFSVTRGE